MTAADGPATGAGRGSHGDEDRLEGDQLPVEDTLDDRGVEDQLDEGYSPPEKLRGSTAKSVTPRGEREGESIEERRAQEEPDPAARVAYGTDPEPGDADPPVDETVTDTVADGEVGEGRSGRFAQQEGEPDGFAVDEGIDGGAASAEEAAVHDVP